MPVTYHQDVAAWATEQARLVRGGQLDVEHIAGDVEDVGKSDNRELASRVAVLLPTSWKCQFQPSDRSTRRERTMREQCAPVLRRL